MDHEGNSILTGTESTVKFSAEGHLLWTAPYAGRGVAVDRQNNILVTGFSEQDVSTVKLAPNGTSIWLRYEKVNPFSPLYRSYSQAVSVNDSGEVLRGRQWMSSCSNTRP